jgi:hypothetical protein
MIAMFSDEQALKILDRLLEKTRAGQVNWRLPTMLESDGWRDATSFVLRLPESSVFVEFESPSSDSDRYVVEFYNKNDVLVKKLTIEEGHPSRGLVQALYSEAGRVAVGWDAVLVDIEKAVGSPGRIGLPSDQSAGRRLDEAVPGGRYNVGGKVADAEGRPIK